MGDYCCKIKRLANGYEIQLRDPEIVKANRESKPSKPWRDPEVGYVFKTIGEVTAFLTKNLEKALPLDEYSTSFDVAAKEPSK